MNEPQKSKRYWSWWMSRLLWYTGRSRTNVDGTKVYYFRDAGDRIILFTENDLKKLEEA